MFGREGPNRLQMIAARVGEMLSQTGTEAKEFKAALKALKLDIDEELSHFLKLYEPSRVDRFYAKFVRLEALLPRLLQLVRNVAAVRERAFTLRDRVRRELDQATSALLSERCGEWIAELDRLAATVERLEDLDAPQSELARIEVVVGQYEEAMRQLSIGAEFIAELGPAKTAAFQAGLPELQQILFVTGPNAHWLEEIEGYLAPLRKMASEVKPEPPRPPEEFHESRYLLTEAHRWSQALRVPMRPDLDDRLQQIEDMIAAGRQADLSGLHADLRSEAERLRGEAAERREQRLQTLGEDARHYEAACGLDPILDEHLQELRAITADSPENYLDWVHCHEKAAGYFRKIARLRVDSLAGYLRNRLTLIGAGLARVQEIELSDTVQENVARLGGAVTQIQNVFEIEDVLEALRKSSSFDRKLVELEMQARKDLAAYERDKGDLLDRQTTLKQAASLTGVDCADFSADLEATVLPGTGLRAKHLWLAQFRGRQEEETERFLAECLSQARGHLQFCKLAHECLARTTRDRSQAPEPIPDTGDPMGAASAFIRVSALRRDLESRMQVAELKVCDDLEQARQRVEGLVATLGFLVSEDHDIAKGWLADLAAQKGRADQELFIRFNALSALFAHYERFFGRFERDEAEVRRIHNELVLRLLSFSDDELRQYFPEGAQRVSALVYGVNMELRQWAQARGQLEEAARLYFLLETQARRRAAAEIEIGCEQLERRLRRTGDPAQRVQMQEALDLVKNLGPREFVSASIRRRMSDYSTGRTLRRTRA